MKLLNNKISNFGFLGKWGGRALNAFNIAGTGSMIAGLVIPDATTRKQAEIQEKETKKLEMLKRNPELVTGLNKLRNTNNPDPTVGNISVANPRPDLIQPQPYGSGL